MEFGLFYSSLCSDVHQKDAWDQRPEEHVLFCPVTGGFRPSPGGSRPAHMTPAWRVSPGLAARSSLVEQGKARWAVASVTGLQKDGPKSCWRFLLS